MEGGQRANDVPARALSLELVRRSEARCREIQRVRFNKFYASPARIRSSLACSSAISAFKSSIAPEGSALHALTAKGEPHVPLRPHSHTIRTPK